MNEHIKRLIEITNYGLEPKSYYEFHLSTEPNLKIGVPFSQQTRTNSSQSERGDMGSNENGMIYSTTSPEQWYDQFKMELADAPEFIPKNLYIVKVKNISIGGRLDQATNKPEDVIVVERIPNGSDGEPNFQLGYSELRKYKN